MLKKVYTLLLENKLLTVILFAGTLAWSITMFKSGLVYKYGMGFWGPNGHDGIWHIAIIESLSKGTLSIPIFAGYSIRNYHIGFDVLLAILYKITRIPVIILYFQVFPPLIAALTGVLVYKFVFAWKKSKIQALSSVFFIYFSGSFGWVVTYVKGKTIDGESLFWAQQSLSTLINPPFALSLLFMLIGFYLMVTGKTKKIGSFGIIILSLIFGVLTQIKIYAGILTIFAIFVGGIFELIKYRKTFLLKIFFLTILISVFILIPTYDLRSGGLLFKPFWFLDSMVSAIDRFYWPKMASALSNYGLSGNIPKEMLAYTLLFIIFLLGNLGVRIISLPYIKDRLRDFKSMDTYEVIFFTIIFSGVLIPMLFIQKGNSWNAIQFFYYSLFLLSLFAGIALGKSIERFIKGKNKDFIKLYMLLALVLFLTVPTLISTLRHYLPGRPPSAIPVEELSALKFLKGQPDGVVLTIPFNRDYSMFLGATPPVPLWLYQSTAYVSAISGKTTYLEDSVNLDIMGYPWKERELDILSNLGNVEYFKNLGIKYVYIPDEEHFVFRDEMNKYSIYNKDNIAVYKI